MTTLDDLIASHSRYEISNVFAPQHAAGYEEQPSWKLGSVLRPGAFQSPDDVLRRTQGKLYLRGASLLVLQQTLY